MAVVAMGRYGGFELSYGSDADVHVRARAGRATTGEEATAYAQAVANELRRLLIAPASDPALVVDADLRPEGKQGPLVRTLASYAAYYAKWSKVWEAQALLRADAVVGDEGAARAASPRWSTRCATRPTGITDADVVEIRRIKARVDRERLPRGADPHTHLKLGRGGLADIEWTVQLLQLRYAGQVPALRSPRTLTALDAARDADLLDAERRTTRSTTPGVRSAGCATRSRWSPAAAATSCRATRASGRRSPSILGYGAGRSDEMVNDYLRTTRRARAVVDRVFWDE